MFGDHSEVGIHRLSVDWLPRGATDVSFYRNSNIANFFAYEFRISRADFEALSHERGWLFKPSVHDDSVPRFTQCLPSDHPNRKEPFSASASVGLFYEVRHGNGGGVAVLYDDEKSMAYVFTSNR